MASSTSEDKSATVIGVVAMCEVVAILAVALRSWTRGIILHQFGIDDYLALASLLLVFSCGIMTIIQTKHGLGKHASTLEPEVIIMFRESFYVTVVLYAASLLFVKLTFLFHYYRLLAVQEMKKVYVAAIIIVGGWALSQVFVGIFFCWPIRGFWDPTVNARCVPTLPQWYANAAGNIVTDVAVFLLPIPVVRKLKLARRERYILLGIFSVGFFTVTISIIRIKYLNQNADVTWENVEPSLWSMAELTSALICACVPTLRPFISRYLPTLASKLGRQTRYYARGYSDRLPSGHNDPASGWKGEGSANNRGPVFHDTIELQNQYSNDRMESRSRSEEGLVGITFIADGGIESTSATSIPVIPKSSN